MRISIRALAVAALLVPVGLVGPTTSAEAAPAAAPSVTLTATRDVRTVCSSLKVDASVPADVRAVEKGVGVLLGCKEIARDPALAFWTDAPRISQLARLAVVADCLPSELDRPRDIIEALRCYPDLEHLDRAALDSELDADPRFDDASKATLRRAMERARASAETWKMQATALVAKNPEARAVLLDAPARALAEWRTAYAANKDGLDAALGVTAKLGTGGARGCSVSMRRHLTTYLTSKGAKTLPATSAAMIDPMGYPIVDALAQCEQLDGEPLAAKALNDGVLAKAQKWHRGPRVAAYWAGVDALDASDGAQRIFGASFRVFRKFPRERAEIVESATAEREHVIAAVKTAKGGGVRVTFADDAAPVLFSAAHANGLVAGQNVVYLQESRGARAFPLSVYADKDKKNAVAFMGSLLVGVVAPPAPVAPPRPHHGHLRRRRSAHR